MKLFLVGLGDYAPLPTGIRQLPITTLVSGATRVTIYKPLVDEWVVYDNSGMKPTQLASGRNT